jgi:negative regulator of replication initiation
VKSTSIRIDMDIYEAIKRESRDFSDTPSLVLRRLLKDRLKLKPADLKGRKGCAGASAATYAEKKI